MPQLSILFSSSQDQAAPLTLLKETSNVLVGVPSPESHPFLGPIEVFSYMKMDLLVPGNILAIMNLTIASISMRGEVDYIFATQGSYIDKRYQSKCSLQC